MAAAFLCMRCINGGDKLPFMEKHNLTRILERLKNSYITYIELETAFDEIGARIETFYKQKFEVLPCSIRINTSHINLHFSKTTYLKEVF